MKLVADVQWGRWLLGVYFPFVFMPGIGFSSLTFFRVFVGPICVGLEWK